MQENRSPKKALLGELESIIDILDDNPDGDFFNMEGHSDQLLDIPLLNDVVDDNNDDAGIETEQENGKLFDLDRIFSDDPFPTGISSENTHVIGLQLETNEENENVPESINTTNAYSELSADKIAAEIVYSKLANSEEEQSEMFPMLEPCSLSQATPANQIEVSQAQTPHSPPQDLNLLIQELVDEFVPVLESRLREQLSALSPDIVQELAEKHLKP